MTRINPFVRMSWIEDYPYLVQQDVATIEAELRKLYPTLVMFPRSYHFHELGDEPRKPTFIDNMVENWSGRRVLFRQSHRAPRALARGHCNREPATSDRAATSPAVR